MILFLNSGVCSCCCICWFCWMNLKNWCFWSGYWCVWFMIVWVIFVLDILILVFWFSFVSSRLRCMWCFVREVCLLVGLIFGWLWFFILGFFLCYSWCVIWFVFVLMRDGGRLKDIILFSVFKSVCFWIWCVVLVYFVIRCLVICFFRVFRFLVLNCFVSLLLSLVVIGFLIFLMV